MRVLQRHQEYPLGFWPEHLVNGTALYGVGNMDIGLVGIQGLYFECVNFEISVSQWNMPSR